MGAIDQIQAKVPAVWEMYFEIILYHTLMLSIRLVKKLIKLQPIFQVMQ